MSYAERSISVRIRASSRNLNKSKTFVDQLKTNKRGYTLADPLASDPGKRKVPCFVHDFLLVRLFSTLVLSRRLPSFGLRLAPFDI
jgi:hypothetical protein